MLTSGKSNKSFDKDKKVEPELSKKVKIEQAEFSDILANHKIEKIMILYALNARNFNKQHTADACGITIKTLYNKFLVYKWDMKNLPVLSDVEYNDLHEAVALIHKTLKGLK